MTLNQHRTAILFQNSQVQVTGSTANENRLMIGPDHEDLLLPGIIFN